MGANSYVGRNYREKIDRGPSLPLILNRIKFLPHKFFGENLEWSKGKVSMHTNAWKVLKNLRRAYKFRDKYIRDEDYEDAVQVWKTFKMKNMKEYHKIMFKL